MQFDMISAAPDKRGDNLAAWRKHGQIADQNNQFVLWGKLSE